MRWTMGLAALAAACSQTTKGTGPGGFPNDATSVPLEDTESDADTDADSDADTDADTDTDTDTDTVTSGPTDTGTAPCTNTVTDQFPVDGATDVFVGAGVWFVLDTADPYAVVTVEDVYGNAVSGATTVDDVLVSWAGDTLVPSTEYVVTLTFDCGVVVSHFTTSAVGDPLGVDVTGWVYEIDLSTGVWLEPLGLGAILAAQLGTTSLLVSPTQVGPDTVTMIGGIGAAGVQDLCLPTAELFSATWDDPFFDLSTSLLTVEVGSTSVDVTDIEVDGAFAVDGSSVEFGTLRASLDTRNLGAALGLGTAYDSVCLFTAIFGVFCETCPDGYDYCLEMAVDDLAAPNIPGTLVPRTQADIDADPTCP